tara:strand:+ start:4176 stop:4391 length:216 start_codon:yes stop_codon:yes gene_type:complete
MFTEMASSPEVELSTQITKSLRVAINHPNLPQVRVKVLALSGLISILKIVAISLRMKFCSKCVSGLGIPLK